MKIIKILAILYILVMTALVVEEILLPFWINVVSFSKVLIEKGYLISGINDFLMIGLLILIIVLTIKVLVRIVLFIWRVTLDDVIKFIGKIFKSSKKSIKQEIENSKPFRNKVKEKIKDEVVDGIEESKAFYNKTKNVYEKIKLECSEENPTEHKKDLNDKFSPKESDIKEVIKQLNKAELDYDDINDVYENTLMQNNMLTIEMNNEENFSLPFDNNTKLTIALNIINYKCYEINQEYLKNYDVESLINDYKKMTFNEFIMQYELNTNEIDLLIEWQDKNLKKDYKERIVDFNNYNVISSKIGEEIFVSIIKK